MTMYWLILFSSILVACQQQPPENVPSPVFFISLTSVCRFNNVEMNPDTSFAAKGSLCAYAEDANIMYSCPAGDPYCWNQGGQCSGGSDTTAGTNQTACSDIGSGSVHWCCNSQFGNCTQTPFQQDNCWSWFDNPNRDLNPIAASSSASMVMQSAAAEPTVTNIVVQALADGGWVTAATTSAVSSGSAVSIPATNAPTTSSVSPAAGLPSASAVAGATTTDTISGSVSISNAAIAGIAIGAAAAAIVVTVLVLKWRQRRREQKHMTSRLNDNNYPSGSLEVQPYTKSYINQRGELSSEQTPDLVHGQPTYMMELDSAAVRPPAFEKGQRDSHWDTRYLAKGD
ncbi:hypothetical protein LTR70_004482 [Exophiala xenobiotica]|uniref:Uncharacterized protein n=1 Tax=Lithohypha guttulata TaxID=1690604 RepID=A0ABR0KFL6_9EURO|nr:hypothetical protein LTR24_003960 [Lithohypha guttulata]KAK5320904.1 hypothetical protein LTR70_004482 [Exophiala xenobiotica]